LPVKTNQSELLCPIFVITAKRFYGPDMTFMNNAFSCRKTIRTGARKLPPQGRLCSVFKRCSVFAGILNTQAWPEPNNSLAICLKKSRINAVKRCSAHQTERYVTWMSHISPLTYKTALLEAFFRPYRPDS